MRNVFTLALFFLLFSRFFYFQFIDWLHTNSVQSDFYAATIRHLVVHTSLPIYTSIDLVGPTGGLLLNNPGNYSCHQNPIELTLFSPDSIHTLRLILCVLKRHRPLSLRIVKFSPWNLRRLSIPPFIANLVTDYNIAAVPCKKLPVPRRRFSLAHPPTFFFYHHDISVHAPCLNVNLSNLVPILASFLENTTTC